ncbi:MAG: M12 family metallo-peptidase [Bacteroidota bacterium]|nr:M12 family metallo-peptidase [Bacteroidota bacterium]
MRSSARSLLLLLIPGLLALVGAMPSKAQSLWSSTTFKSCDYAPDRGETVLSCVTLDASVVDMATKQGASFLVPVNGLDVPVSGVASSMHDSGAVTIQGIVGAEQYRTFHLSIAGETAAGHFWKDGQLFEVRPLKDGGAVLLQVDTRERRPSTDDVIYAPRSTRAWQLQQHRAGKRVAAQIDMLILWDDAVVARVGESGRASLEASYMDYLNSAVADGGNPDIVFTVAHSEMVSWNENQSSDMGDDLVALATDDDGVFDDVFNLREQHSADLVHLILDQPKDFTCGIAYQTLTGANLGYGVTAVDGCGMDTFAHEVGHNMGMGHDRYVTSDYDDAFQLWSHGYVDLTNEVKTIMAYDNECFDFGQSCTALPYFSDPGRSVNGVPIGIADDAPNWSANNTRVLMETAENRAGYSDIIASCLADVYGPQSGPATAQQGEEMTFTIPMVKNNLATNCAGDPSLSIYLTGAGLDTYFVGRSSIALTESITNYDITGTPLSPVPPTGTYSVLLFDDAQSFYYVLDLEVEITAGTGVSTEDIELPGEYRLTSAYPNPFNPRTTIAFEAGGTAPVSITVTDMLGRVRSTLLDQQILSAGNHHVSLDAADLPTGTYLIRLEAGRLQDVMTITLVR